MGEDEGVRGKETRIPSNGGVEVEFTESCAHSARDFIVSLYGIGSRQQKCICRCKLDLLHV